ncbi:MAG TPA: VWA domain-containing protein [Acidobacteriaceae bacterium]|nr:VWA domain-containing protein [Acidobacteriaceae bacterium]
MRLASGRILQCAVGFGVFCAGAAAVAQAPGVPDAPAPQTLPRLNTITPTAPATPNAPLPSAPVAQPTTPAPGSTLPSTPAPTPQAQEDADSGPPPESHAATIVRQVNFVEIPFTVKDSKGQLVPGLTYRDVQVYENGLRQQIRLFTVDPIPLSVALVIDQSVTFDTMQKINASLTALQGAFTPYDEVSIFTYNNGVKQQTGFTGAQSFRLTTALERSKAPGREANMAMGGPLACTTCKNNLPVDPNTNGNNSAGVILQTPEREYHTLNDAILTAAETVAKAGKGRRRVIYVISDGKEYGSTAKTKEVVRFLQTNQIAVYGTLVGDSAIPGLGFLDRIHLPLQMRDDVLPHYADATGGQCDPEFRPRGIQDSFAKLAEQVRTQYTVGYYSHEPFIDGKFRSVEVRVLRPSLDVIAKKGYYPTAEQSGPSRPATATAAPAVPASGPAQP